SREIEDNQVEMAVAATSGEGIIPPTLTAVGLNDENPEPEITDSIIVGAMHRVLGDDPDLCAEAAAAIGEYDPPKGFDEPVLPRGLKEFRKRLREGGFLPKPLSVRQFLGALVSR
ncbi:hypothetical protein HY389_00660, partial [Candidatus Daviesbacteria bacterium]|nr:hypothetical protein [Candidatus Daviesbacteria bacterium]